MYAYTMVEPTNRKPRRFRSLLIASETGEGPAVVVALVEDRRPGEARLGAFQDQELEEPPVVVHRHAPFLVVISQVLRAPQAPGTATPGVDFVHRSMIPFEHSEEGGFPCWW